MVFLFYIKYIFISNYYINNLFIKLFIKKFKLILLNINISFFLLKIYIF